MNYRFAEGESVPHGVKRMAGEQLDAIIANLSPPFRDHGTAVHDARKSLKKLRAILRLVAEEIGRERYAEHNLIFRDAARRLSAMRDAAVLLEVLETLRREKGSRKLEPLFERAAAALKVSPRGEEDQEGNRQEMEGVMEEIARNLLRMRRGIERWPIERDDFRALRGGIRKVYKRGRKGFAEVLDEPSSVNLHEWRKQVKYLWYQIRLLKPVWPSVLKTLADELRELAEVLGEDHDLAMLRSTLRERMGEDADELAPILKLIEKRRGKLQEQAMACGARVFSEPPKGFVRRLEGYWTVWRGKGK